MKNKLTFLLVIFLISGLAFAGSKSAVNVTREKNIDKLSPNNYKSLQGKSSLKPQTFSAQATIVVPTNQPTLQAAITAAVDGDVIQINAGTYTEVGQIVIDKNLTITGADKTTTILKPDADYVSWIVVNAGKTVNLAKVTIDGTTREITRALLHQGDGVINDCIFTEIKNQPSGPAYAGTAIKINSVGNVDVTNCIFTQIGRNGILADGCTGTYSGNTYLGKGVGDWLDYFILSEYGDNVVISNNIVSNNIGIASVDGSTSCAIAVWDDPGTRANIIGNTLTNNTTGVAIVAINGGGSDPTVTIGAGNLFEGGEYGVAFQIFGGTPACNPAVTFTGISTFKGQLNQAITIEADISNGQTIDIIGSVFQTAGGTAIINDFDIENLIYHAVDATNRGRFKWSAGNIYVPTGGTINNAISSAEPFDEINIEPGTYSAFTITGSNLTINGNGAIVNHGSPAITVAANNTTITGFAFNFGTADYAIQVNAGVTGTVVSDCNFNVTNGIDNQSTNPVNAEYNYWGFGGNVSGPTIASNIGGTGSVITEALAGTVDYNPWVGKNSTPLNAATLVSVNTSSVTWDWLNFFGPNFAFQLDFDGVAGSLVNTSVATNSAAIPTPLTYNTTYRWFVRSIADPLNTWIGPFTFTTQNIPAPVLTAPANTLTGVPIRPTFSWTWSGIGAVTYRLEVSTSNTFATTVIDTTGLNTLSLLMPEYHKLSNNITYYWRVTVTQGLNSSTSAISSFSTTPVVTISPINPINGSTGVYFDPTYFSFQVVNGFTGTLKYLVQYHVKTTVPTIAEWAGANTFTLTNLLSELPYPITLLANSKYYWRVVVLNASDEVVSYSGNYYFTTKSGAPTPYLSYPIGGQPVATNSPSFFWYIGTYDLTNITFDLEIATNAAFTLNHQAVTNINGLQYDWGLAPLTPGTTYYWRITTWYKKGNVLEQHSSTSSYSTFKAMGTGTATTPYLSYPVGGLSIYTTTPTLYWYTGASTDGVVFDVYIKLSSAGGYTQIADNTTNLYFDMSGPLLNPFTLAAGSTYNWYVVATGGNGAFTSSVSSFVVNSSLGTGSVIASWPLGNPYVYSLTPTLYWYMYGSQTGLTKYVIKYSQTNTDLTQGAWTALGGGVDLALTETSYTIPTNLTAGSKYYWAIAGYNGGSLVTSWSTGSFTISTTTTAVNVYLSTPIGGTTVYTLTPTLYWYATGAISGITSYDITYSNTSNFLGGLPPAFVTTVNTGTDNFYTLPSNAALAGATIYWKVTVNYAGGPSTSTTGSFVIDPGSSNVVPLVGSPINNTELKATAATLSWFTPAQSKAKLSYTVEYSESSNFANAKIASGLSEPQLNISGLKENTTYYWRAKSVDPQGTSSKFSEVALFRTSGKVTGVEEQEIPSQFELSQNYPNPFNPTTVISYALPKNTFVTIKVYDMLGREIKTLVNKENAAGRYSVDWNGDDNFGSKVSTGAYVYRITTSDFVSVKKMILIK